MTALFKPARSEIHAALFQELHSVISRQVVLITYDRAIWVAAGGYLLVNSKSAHVVHLYPLIAPEGVFDLKAPQFRPSPSRVVLNTN
jgi:hypothetical protein